MSRIDDLAPDQRAVLQLLLRQGKSYDELAGMLRLDHEAVRERAARALDALGPADTDVDAERRAEIGDYLLGQQSASQRRATRELLETSAPARAWARVVSGELRPVAGDGLPEVPAEAAEVDEAFDALQARDQRRAEVQRSSRLGGALLIVGAIVIAVTIVLIVRGGGNDNGSSASTSTPAKTSTSKTSTTTPSGGQPQVVSQSNMTPAPGVNGVAAVLFVLRQNSQYAVAVQAQGLQPTTASRFYAAWLIGRGVNPRPLGFTPVVAGTGKQAGRLAFANALPSDANKYSKLVITAESQKAPTQPGPVVLRGDLKFGP